MSLVTNSTNKNGKTDLVVITENGLDWSNENTGKSGVREPASALTDVAREAHILSKMDQGNVSVSIQDKDGNYTTYYPRETQKGDIALMPSAKDQAENGKEPIYFNKKYETEESGKVKRDPDSKEPLYYFAMNKDTDAAKNLLDNMKINEFERQNGEKGQALATRVTLHNPELAKAMNEYQKAPDDPSPTIAVISKEGVEIGTRIEFAARKAEKTQEATKSVDAGMDR